MENVLVAVYHCIYAVRSLYMQCFKTLPEVLHVIGQSTAGVSYLPRVSVATRFHFNKAGAHTDHLDD